MAEQYSENLSYRPIPIPKTSRVPVTDSASWSPFTIDHPVILRPDEAEDHSGSRAEHLMNALRKQENTIVDVELGTYDDIPTRNFDKIAMPLGRYLDWLQETKEGTVGGKQLYLAQWVGREQVDAAGGKVPGVLQPLLDDGRVDLYMEAVFLGPTGAVTPFHYDPYMNLFHLQASSNPSRFAKHVMLLPPSSSPYLQHTERGSSVLGNTSKIKARLRHQTSQLSEVDFECEVLSDTGDTVVEAMAEYARVCVLREGETLFIPKGWWHRVENVVLDRNPRLTVGWTAGVSWWFLPRNNPKAMPQW